MAKETKVEREQRLALEATARFVEATKVWNVQLAALMVEFATTPGFAIHKYNANNQPEHVKFNVPVVLLVDPDEWAYHIRVTPESEDDVEEMEAAKQRLYQYHKDQAEYARKREVKAAALAKLNPEEKELLGL